MADFTPLHRKLQLAIASYLDSVVEGAPVVAAEHDDKAPLPRIVVNCDALREVEPASGIFGGTVEITVVTSADDASIDANLSIAASAQSELADEAAVLGALNAGAQSRPVSDLHIYELWPSGMRTETADRSVRTRLDFGVVAMGLDALSPPPPCHHCDSCQMCDAVCDPCQDATRIAHATPSAAYARPSKDPAFRVFPLSGLPLRRRPFRVQLFSVTPITLATLEQVSRSFQRGRVTALSGIDLDVEESASLAILGPSGSGKSTLLHILGAMDRPTLGRVRYQWGEPDGAAARARCRARCIGFVFQSFHLLPNLSAIENVQVPMIGVVRGAARRLDRARVLLRQVGLRERECHRPQDLSGGERQRVAIARALANSPRMILADEPTGNLDTQTSRAILDLLLEVRVATGAALVVVTHNPEVAARLDRTLTLLDGRVVAPGDPPAL